MAGEIAEPTYAFAEIREEAIRPQKERFQEIVQKVVHGKETKTRLVSVA